MQLDNVKEIHIEPTSLCNAECPQCARNINGSGLNPNIQLNSLTINYFTNFFNNDNIANIKKIFFCGNVGDPCATPDLLEICRYLKSIKPDLVLGVNTNGSLKTEDWFRELGSIFHGPLDYVVFSIDGLDDTNHIYRRNTNWSKIMRNARAYISTGASAHWDMLVFDHNQHQVDSAQRLAREMGFTWFRSKTTDRWDSHPATDDLKPSEPYVAKDYADVDIVCEKNRDRSIFIDYLGEIWPCCHMAEAYLSTVGRDKHQDIRQYSNKELMTKYHGKLLTNPFYVCRRSCGVNTGKKSQWKKEIQLQ